jgi:hypothetical protein
MEDCNDKTYHREIVRNDTNQDRDKHSRNSSVSRISRLQAGNTGIVV